MSDNITYNAHSHGYLKKEESKGHNVNFGAVSPRDRSYSMMLHRTICLSVYGQCAVLIGVREIMDVVLKRLPHSMGSSVVGGSFVVSVKITDSHLDGTANSWCTVGIQTFRPHSIGNRVFYAVAKHLGSCNFR